ncbi:MAG TPA: hypothetical protein DCZ94_19725 [Lentisphaeria bacterium]|nr:MAG: hypothetical protein A2X48_22435 [Lentisphaerae bacterium GWF2_49_21]HBC89175.1 hypothetical protein [Lentisphaeria bacterium]
MKTKRYFTVIELLVVLAVVMVVFSVLCHSFIRAKEIARRAYCLNNLRQISTLANLYNVDRGNAPYSQHWLVDFTFCSDYLETYGVLECPSMEDKVRSASDLNGNTSYHYMGSRQDWLKNNIASGDGTEYGFDSSNAAIQNLLSSREEKLVYDKTDAAHEGIFNVVYIESSSAEVFSGAQTSSVWFVTESGSLNFPEGLAVASTASSTAVTVASNDTGHNGGGNLEQNEEQNMGTTTQNQDTNQDVYQGEELTDDGNDNLGTTSNQEGTSTTASTTDGKTNNGHGNNEDGVDVSNPGNSKTGEDTDPTVDDETKGGKK